MHTDIEAHRHTGRQTDSSHAGQQCPSTELVGHLFAALPDWVVPTILSQEMEEEAMLEIASGR